MADDRLVALSPGDPAGQWIIDKKLGAGAFGAVYLCHNKKGVRAALKTEPEDTRYPLLAMEV